MAIDKHIAAAMGLRDDELDYVYQNPEGDIVFLPIMQIYNDAFFEAEYKNITNWAEAYVNDIPTSLYERYILNYTQFSAAKTLTEAKELQKLVFDNDGKVKPIGRFINEANEYKKQISDTWLRVEYDNATGNAVMADKWQQIEEDKDIYPYWKYQTMHDSRVRHDHAELDGKVFEIGDPFGDSIVPRNDWNCRCRAVSVDHGKPQTKAQSKELLDKYVNEQFRFNPAKQGMFPKKDCPYIDNLKAAGNKIQYTSLSAMGAILPPLADVANQLHNWQHDKKKIVFKNDRLKLNVFLNPNMMDKIRINAPSNYGKIDKAIMYPNEIWGTWLNKEQTETRFYFILFSHVNLVVSVEGGGITKVEDMVQSKYNRLSKGLPIFLKK